MAKYIALIMLVHGCSRYEYTDKTLTQKEDFHKLVKEHQNDVMGPKYTPESEKAVPSQKYSNSSPHSSLRTK